MYKSILVHVDLDDAGTADRVQLALHLAEDCHATVIGVAASLPPATIELLASGGAAIAAGVMVGAPDDLDERFATARAEFLRWTDGAPVRATWRTAVDFPAPAIASMAACADLLVVGPGRRSSPANSYLDYGDVIMRAGRPVLMVPHGTSRLNQSAAVVAWRNTRESRRALADALPLLATTAAVTLLHVREASDDAEEARSIADAKDFLAAHSIGATVETVDQVRGSSTEALLEFAGGVQAGFLVAGTYGHSRVREWVFGGVSRDLLQDCRIACLFSR
jgi:nucleotide-binding universal stress UspA family protein